MDFPKSGVKGFFEILMPGVFLLLNLLGTLGLLMMAFATQEQRDAALKFVTSQTYALSLILSFGYLLGVVLRSFRTEIVDCLSGRFIRFVKCIAKWAVRLLLAPCIACRVCRRFRRSAIKRFNLDDSYLTEPFFYDSWMQHKCSQRFAPPVLDFYERHWSARFSPTMGYRNTTFFNLCKSILNKVDPNSASEAYAAEAMTRFLAGSFYALFFAFVLALVDVRIVRSCSPPDLCCLPAVLAILYFLLMLGILWEFRLLRCKEVDVVFSACFTNRVYFEDYFGGDTPPTPGTHSNVVQRDIRRQFLETLWREEQAAHGGGSAIKLESLVRRMKREKRIWPFLSSLYFAGADVDHPYFLETDAVAIGIAVLPEDAAKAQQRKRHPNQFELIFVLEGSLCLYTDGAPLYRVMRKGDVHEIPKNVCHWITPHENNDAVYLFVKTDPVQEPRSVDC